MYHSTKNIGESKASELATYMERQATVCVQNNVINSIHFAFFDKKDV